MNIKEELAKLHNTLAIVETRGDNTKIMADCLRFIEQLVAQIPDEPTVTNDKEAETSK